MIVDSTALISAERTQRSVLEVLTILRNRFEDADVALSVVSAYELTHGVWRANSPGIRASREAFVEEVLIRIPICPVGLRVARIAAQIDADLKSRGSRIPLADLLIGATALSLNFAVATASSRHFERLPGLEVLEFHA